MEPKRPPTPLLIACGILREEISTLIDQGRIAAATHFLSSRLHRDPALLAKALRAAMAFWRRRHSRRIVVVYGDACLGFNGQMQQLVDEFGLVKVNAVNCIDCQLGGNSRLLEIDPEHKYFFLNKAFLHFGQNRVFAGDPAAVRDRFKMLEASVPIDPLGDLQAHASSIQRIGALTGLPVRDCLAVGLEGVEQVVAEAIGRLGRP